ncbi:uncharacterized protein LOC112599232 [Melanaphis sacchari]|uniref:uncharacterized protein LOC112599232 n=1 Tax=Melanaphis sacchari TaxID=742174 RepID=UPI000DC14348|nr:uncharacterized protein LOC112599232 [Melanaphis sacchari]
MHQRTIFFALLQCTAIFACHLKSKIPRSQRSIIEMPTFFSDRFAQEQRCSVVGYDGQYRQIFEETVDDKRYSGSYSLQPKAQLPAEPEKLRCVRNDDAWWLAVIENINRNNEKILQHEIETKETCRQFRWILSCSQ